MNYLTTHIPSVPLDGGFKENILLPFNQSLEALMVFYTFAIGLHLQTAGFKANENKSLRGVPSTKNPIAPSE
jgi:hypothetical protein